MKTIPSPLKWHGGKGAFQGKLAKWIVSLMPKHTHYVEPYFGGGSVLLAKDPEGVSEVVNDINSDLTNFWTVLQQKSWFRCLARKLEATPFSEASWEATEEGLRHGRFHPDMRSPILQAYWFFIRCRQSLAGRMNAFAPLSKTRTRRGMNEQVSAWLTAIDGLPEVHARMIRVAILAGDALDVIRQEDGKDTLSYLDPPYLQATRTARNVYEYEMTVEDHAQLLALLSKHGTDGLPEIDRKPDWLAPYVDYDLKGKFILSGYRSRPYDATAELNGWHRRDFEIPNNAAGGNKKRKMTECVWMNYEPP